MSRKLILLIAVACLVPTLLSAQPTQYMSRSRGVQDPDAVIASDNVSDVQLRATVILERALQSYLLAYEAFKQSRKSKNKEVRARMPEFLHNYRVAYANFISILHEDNLYKPQEPPNPAGKYDKKRKQETGYGMLWPELKIKHLRKNIKKMVSNGATPTEVIAEINASLPTVNLAQPDLPPMMPSNIPGN